MEPKLTILKPFFEDPNKQFSIRQLSRILKINHTTIRQHLNKMVKEEILSLKKEGVYSFYRITLSKKTLNLKLYYNLEKIRTSHIIEEIEKVYDFPIIVLFGSYSSATDSIESDVDMCIVSNIEKGFPIERYEKILNRKISLHKFTKNSFVKAKRLNKELINNICNGIVLSGELEIL